MNLSSSLLWGASLLLGQTPTPVPTPACSVVEERTDDLCAASLADLFHEIATRMELMEANVHRAVVLSEEARALAADATGVELDPLLPRPEMLHGLFDAVSEDPGAAPCPEPCLDEEPVEEIQEEVADEATLVSIRTAESRLADLEARIAELENLEAQLLAGLEQHLSDAGARADEILATVHHEAGRLEQLRVEQAGKVDLSTAVAGFRDTLVQMELPELFENTEQFLRNFDDFTAGDLQTTLDEMAYQLENAHLGSWFLEHGQSLRGVDLGEMLIAMGEELDGQPAPAEVTEVIQTLNQYGGLGWVRMLKGQAKGVSLGMLFQPLVPELEGLDLGAAFTQMAETCEGDVAAACCFGLGSALSDIDAAHICATLARELEPITLMPLAAALERAFMGGDIGDILVSAGRSLRGIDVGEKLVTIGRALEPIGAASVTFRVATEMEGITVAQAVDELEWSLHQMGVDLDLPAVMKQSGDQLARQQLPRRIEGLVSSLDQFDDYLLAVREEMGLVPTDLMASFSGTQFAPASECRCSNECCKAEATACAEAPSAVAECESVVSQNSAALEEMAAARAKEIEKLSAQLQLLRNGGLDEEHPAVKKLVERLAALRDEHSPIH